MKESTHTELWRIGHARVFVAVCNDDAVEGQRGSRTRIESGITRVDGQAQRESM